MSEMGDASIRSLGKKRHHNNLVLIPDDRLLIHETDFNLHLHSVTVIFLRYLNMLSTSTLAKEQVPYRIWYYLKRDPGFWE